MTRIGIISDTHGTLDSRAYALLADNDYIIHAGDICNPSILRDLEALAPVTAVLGNNDYPEYGDEVTKVARPVIDGVRFLVTHYPPTEQKPVLGSFDLKPGDPVPDVYIHGHTHVPRIAIGNYAHPAGVLLCPGSASRPRRRYPPSVALMQVEQGHFMGAQIITLDGDMLLAIGETTDDDDSSERN